MCSTKLCSVREKHVTVSIFMKNYICNLDYTISMKEITVWILIIISTTCDYRWFRYSSLYFTVFKILTSYQILEFSVVKYLKIFFLKSKFLPTMPFLLTTAILSPFILKILFWHSVHHSHRTRKLQTKIVQSYTNLKTKHLD